jgi:hypothetical protein
MKKIGFLAAIMVVSVSLAFMSGCKTTERILDDFSIITLSGYSKNVTTLDPDDMGYTTINLFVALKNNSEVSGTITGWSFQIRDNIVTLLEINHQNFQDYNLVLSGDIVIPPEEVSEIYIKTPQPFEANALTPDTLSFAPYIPRQVVVEIEVSKDNGETETIQATGTYTYERTTKNESRYNIIGQWEFKRVVKGESKARQKIDFVGTKVSGKYVIYNFDSGEADETGSYVVSNYKNLTFTSDNGSQYWGEFTDPTHMNGTLLIPENRKENQETQTGSWAGKKL